MHLTIRIFLLLTALVIALYHVEGKNCLFVRIFMFAFLSYTCYNVKNFIMIFGRVGNLAVALFIRSLPALDERTLLKYILTLGRKGGRRGWMPHPPHKVFLSFFQEDKTSVPGVLSSCSFIPRSYFETSLVMVGCYGYEI